MNGMNGITEETARSGEKKKLPEGARREIVRRELARRGFGRGAAKWALADKPEVVAACLAAAESLAEKIAGMNADEHR